MTTLVFFPRGFHRTAQRTGLGVCWLALLGCPLYSDDCVGHCAPGYRCESYTGACLPIDQPPPVCTSSDPCGPAETCAPGFTCRRGSCADRGCVSEPDAAAPDAAISDTSPDASSGAAASALDSGS